MLAGLDFNAVELGSERFIHDLVDERRFAAA